MKIIAALARLALATLLTSSVACGGPNGDELADASEEAALTPVGRVGSTPVPTVTDPCRTMAADNTQSLGASDSEDLASSVNAAYGNRAGCPRFIADFNVLSSASPGQYHGPNFTAEGYVPELFSINDESKCENTRISVRRYRKAVGSASVSLISTAIYDYAFAAPQGGFSSCLPILTSGTDPSDFLVSPYGTQTFRIAVRATRSGVAIPVGAYIRFPSTPG